MNSDELEFQAAVPATGESAWQENKRLLLAALLAAGAREATISYAGSGDSGSIEQVNVEMQEGKSFDPSALASVFEMESDFADGQWTHTVVRSDMPIEDALRDFAEEAIERHHGGYENNDGGAGEVIFDCDTLTVRIEHNDYFTDSEYTETQL